MIKDGAFEELPNGGVLARAGVEVSAAFLAARRFGRRRAFASQTFWWTIGGEGFPSLALLEVGPPPATRFADMLTGAFSDRAAVALGTRRDRRHLWAPAFGHSARIAYHSA